MNEPFKKGFTEKLAKLPQHKVEIWIETQKPKPLGQPIEGKQATISAGYFETKTAILTADATVLLSEAEQEIQKLNGQVKYLKKLCDETVKALVKEKGKNNSALQILKPLLADAEVSKLCRIDLERLRTVLSEGSSREESSKERNEK